MGGLAEGERDNEVLIMTSWTNSKAKGMLWWPGAPARPPLQPKNLQFDPCIEFVVILKCPYVEDML